MRVRLHQEKIYTVVFFALLAIIPFRAATQTAESYCLKLTASVQQSPSNITLHWRFDTVGVTNYLVSKKSKSAISWGTSIATLPPTSTSYTDAAVNTDTAYEYKVRKTTTTGGSDGYIWAGIQSPAIEYRGKLWMIVDSSLNDSLSFEVNRLMKDISGDGWAVERTDVSRSMKDTDIKNFIRSQYLADSLNLKAVLLVGHVAVPYSGRINPDGHGDHRGAWPADIYYGNMHLNFTDVTVADSSASRVANRNVPGDGKWDPSWIFGSKTELQISRIDLSNMPAFGRTENQLMRSYLDKDHDYRMKNITTQARGLIDDNFGAFGGEAFSISGWRNFAPLLGDSNIVAADYITTLDTAQYQWSYGCGGGNYTGAGGVGSTSSFINRKVQSIFTMLFGSYFGDWDVSNNFLRAPLCAPEPALTNCWAGRPHWMFHHMALGEHIGYSANLTQNQSGSLYQMNYASGYIHVALMGDLTLRQHIVAPPAITTLSDTNENVNLAWSSSSDNVLGYYVYQSDSEFGKYERRSPSVITGNGFTDIGAGPGMKYYMVKAVKLESTPSGTYYNLSEGIADSLSVRDTFNIATAMTEPGSNKTDFSLYPNPAKDVLTLEISSDESPSGTIEILDIRGSVWHSMPHNGKPGKMMIPVSFLPSGVYFCRLIGEEGVMEKRFEVVR